MYVEQSAENARQHQGLERGLFGSFWRSDRSGIVALALLTIVACAQLFRGGVLIGQDSATQFYPWYDYLGERLLAGHIPGWNPYQFAGVPFAADPQSGWTYLPAMLVFTLFPISSAVPIFITMHLVLTGAGTYLLSRLLGIGIGGAIVAAAAYELASPLYGRSVCCPAQFEVGSWLPLALAGAELAIRSRSSSWRLLGWIVAGLSASQALAAWLGQGGYYFLLVLAAYIAYRTLFTASAREKQWIGRPLNALLHGSAIFGIAFALAAAGLLPRLEYISRSNLANGEYGGENSWAAVVGGVTPGMALDQLIDPTLYYPGVAVLALAVAALFIARNRAGVPFFAGLGICATILATPWDTPLHRLFYLLFPKFEQLHQHWPERVAIVSYLAIAMLAGATTDSLCTRPVRRRAAVLGLGIPAAFLLVLIAANRDLLIVPLAVLLTTLLLAGLLMSPRVQWLRPAIPVLLAVVITIDLVASFSHVSGQGPYGGFHRVDIGKYYGESKAALFLQERMKTEPGRYIGFDPRQQVLVDGQQVLYRYQFATSETGAILVNNRGVLHAVEDAQGYNPVQPRRFVEYLTALNGRPQEYHDANVYRTGLDSPLLDLLNIRYIVIPADFPETDIVFADLDKTFSTIYSDDQVRVLENPTALPRAWIVHEAMQVSTQDVLPLLQSQSVDPRQTALLESPAPPLDKLSNGSVDSVELISDEPEQLTLKTQTDAPGLLVLSESYDPNWKAYVDGKEVDVLTANYLLRAIPIPTGTRTVELRYESQPLKLGVAISSTSALILTAAFGGIAVSAVRRRRQIMPASVVLGLKSQATDTKRLRR